MKTQVWLTAVIFASSLLGAGMEAPVQAASAFPLHVTDDAGHAVTVSAQPVRIASVTEATDEILSALVPKKDIVLVTSASSNASFSNITSFVKGIPQIASANSEQIIAARPDLVLLASYTKPGVVNQVEQAGMPAYEFNDFNSIADIRRNIEVVGSLVGQERKAKAIVTKMNQQIQAVLMAVKGHHKLRVLDYGSYGYAAGRNTTVNDIIVDAGGINAAAKLNGWQPVTDEEIVKLNPDVIIDSDDDSSFVGKLEKNPAFRTVSAIKNHRVCVVKGADLSSASQYITRGILDVAKLLDPGVKVKGFNSTATNPKAK